MQIIRLFFLVLLAITANASWAQVAQSKGKATITYSGFSIGAEDKLKAQQNAQLKAIEFYYAEEGQTEAQNFETIREKFLADPEKFILDSTILSEELKKDTKQYSVVLRVSLNVANLRNAVKSNSAAGKVAPAQKSILALLMIAREVDSVKTYDAREVKRVEVTENISANASASADVKANANVDGQFKKNTSEGENLKKGSVKTDDAKKVKGSLSTNSNANLNANASTNLKANLTIETGGSSTQKSAESTWRLFPSSNLSQVFTANFTRSGFKVSEAALIEPYTGGLFSLASVENDYKSGQDLKPATLQSMIAGMRKAQIPYVALGTLDAGQATDSAETGLKRVSITVNAKILDITALIPDTIASVGPVIFAGEGPTEDEARTNALKLAATNASRELASQITSLQIR